MNRAPWTDADIETIRTSVATMNDKQIAALLGWPYWRVVHVRLQNKIPPHHQEFWPQAVLDHIRARYVVAGASAAAVAAELKAMGFVIPEATIRRKVLRMGWERSPGAERRNSNLANARIGEAKRAKKEATATAPKPAQPRPLPGPMLSLHNAPKRWKAVEDPRPLDEKIIAALKVQPLSVVALASIIGAKEHAVDVQLAALAHAGGVEASPAAECGRRNRLWRAAA